MGMHYGSQNTRGPWGPSDWKDDEEWLAQRDEFHRGGEEVADDFSRYRSRHRGYRGEESGWPRRWGQTSFDAEYQQWRDEQLRKFDEDYEAWRSERYRKFSSEFDDWRKNWQSAAASQNAAGDGAEPTDNSGR